MNRTQLVSTALCCFFACTLSIATVSADNFDSNPVSTLTPIEDNPQVAIQDRQPILESNPISAENWLSDEAWLLCSVVIALVGVTIMRKTVH